jgi:hypothetical protein
MLYPFFAVAALSPGRQRAFRYALVAHLGLLAAWLWAAQAGHPAGTVVVLGNLLLTAGIIEGASLMGWRLTQLPKSRALEFLLVSPLSSGRVFLAEALVGVGRLALVTLAGLPLLALLVVDGWLEAVDVPALLVMPLTWGLLTGLGLTVWAFEPLAVRRWSERSVLALVVVYLGIGVLAGEHLRQWIAWLPQDLGQGVLFSFYAFHRYNPFAVVRFWLEEDTLVTWERTLAVELGALAVIGLLLVRAACRFKGHFHERHYLPAVDRSRRGRGWIGDRPLTWWAVRRVLEYSGRVNLWLAGGFGLLYAVYTLAGPHWPPWLGRRVFEIFDQVGGIAALATALVVLAAVPAAFQYGLWDSHVQDRCRRLELLLLTRLEERDYWEAAAAAAWRRGRGYFAVAVLLWTAGVLAGRLGIWQGVAALAAGVVLWGVYFALGFRAFARGLQANGLGLLLTVGLPMLAGGLYGLGQPVLAALLPPGNVYTSSAGPLSPGWLLGPVLGGVTALAVARRARACCDRDLRDWYALHQGRQTLN